MMMKRRSAGPCKGTKLVGNRSQFQSANRSGLFPEKLLGAVCARIRLDLERISSTSITEIIPFRLHSHPGISLRLLVSKFCCGREDSEASVQLTGQSRPKLGTLILAHHQHKLTFEEDCRSLSSPPLRIVGHSLPADIPISVLESSASPLRLGIISIRN
jgi:hypothetical protein